MKFDFSNRKNYDSRTIEIKILNRSGCQLTDSPVIGTVIGGAISGDGGYITAWGVSGAFSVMDRTGSVVGIPAIGAVIATFICGGVDGGVVDDVGGLDDGGGVDVDSSVDECGVDECVVCNGCVDEGGVLKGGRGIFVGGLGGGDHIGTTTGTSNCTKTGTSTGISTGNTRSWPTDVRGCRRDGGRRN